MSGIVGHAALIPISKIRPNPWNPNAMDDAMLARERASIEKFGFIGTAMVRSAPDGEWELVDGEHRWRIARELGMEELPCWDLGTVSDLVAKELSLVLREIHGDHDPARVQAILREIAKTESAESLRLVLPYSEEVYARLGKLNSTFDWKALEDQAKEKPTEPSTRAPRHWVERLYRLSAETTETLDEALRMARENSGDPDLPDADALGIVASGYIEG
jgi:ParB family chromosome partitioning protein